MKRLWTGMRLVSWTFQLNKRTFPVQTTRRGSYYRAEMEQGICDFGATLSAEESIPFLESLNLGRDHLLGTLPLQIASTGLAYLLVAVDRDLDKARIINPEFEKQLARFWSEVCLCFRRKPETGKDVG
jgi:predicted PhzF superfamily epimerase YddE/YHI9